VDLLIHPNYKMYCLDSKPVKKHAVRRIESIEKRFYLEGL